MSSAPEMGQAHGALSTAAGMVAGAKADFDQLDRELVGHLEAAQALWTGRGGAAFLSLGRAWTERQRTIVGALADFEASLRSTERDNVATDDAQSAAFAHQLQRLG
jgi:uncharacterized protein YukE